MSDDIKTHPVQTNYRGQHTKDGARCPQSVTMAAYEVYKALHGEQEALVTGGCRGGFGVGELIAYLYAKSFPRTEWRARAEEAFRGMLL